jgi:F420-dependent oxidoreductase-like protein
MIQLGLALGYASRKVMLPIDLVQQAESFGYRAVWTSESYGSDALTPLAWLGACTQRIQLGTAILQMPARTPAATAMAATTLDQLSGGRFLLGLGVSGPQVVEGWHGQPYGKPLERTREYVAILRQIFARRTALQFQGNVYQIPYQGAGATGLGKPLKSLLYGRQIPIYLAALGPKNVTLAAQIGDGWLPLFLAPEFYAQTYAPAVAAGLALAGKAASDFVIAPTLQVVLTDETASGLESGYDQIRPNLALYIGGMGARSQNFYFELACRYGFPRCCSAYPRLLFGR